MVGLDEETLTTSLSGVRARKPPDWLIEERRSTLGHWAAFCLSCGHTLRYFEESPKLPYGYFGTTLITLFARKRIRRLLTQELERRELGPFTREVAAAS